MTDADVTQEELQAHIDDGTFIEFLRDRVIVTPHRTGDNRLQLEVDFPAWFFEYVNEESRADIMSLIRQNAAQTYANLGG